MERNVCVWRRGRGRQDWNGGCNRRRLLVIPIFLEKFTGLTKFAMYMCGTSGGGLVAIYSEAGPSGIAKPPLPMQLARTTARVG